MSWCFSTVQSDELSLQKKLRTEVIQLEDTLAQVRKEYEMLRIEFEQNLAANEQAGTFSCSSVHHLLAQCEPCILCNMMMSLVHRAVELIIYSSS